MSENYFYSSLSAQEIEDTLIGAVVFNSGQTLSTSQKAQARQNIGAGAENTGFRILGYFDTLEDLQEYLQLPPQAGDAYGIGTSVPYDIYVWDAANEDWVDNGPLDIAEFIDDSETSSILTWSSQKIDADKQDTIGVNGLLKGDGNGSVQAATLGSDYTAVDDSLPTSANKTYSIDKIKQEIAGATPTGVVHYDEAQTLTSAEKEQARENISAEKKWSLLWTNPAPTSSFPEQTLNYDLTQYSEVRFIVLRDKQNSLSDSLVMPAFDFYVSDLVTMAGQMSGTHAANNEGVRRIIRNVSSSSFQITTAYTGVSTTSNDVYIPYKIYVKT